MLKVSLQTDQSDFITPWSLKQGKERSCQQQQDTHRLQMKLMGGHLIHLEHRLQKLLH